MNFPELQQDQLDGSKINFTQSC